MRFEVAERRPLFFMHVPKTGGTSLRFFLHNQYPQAQVLNANDWGSSLACLGSVAQSHLVVGHFPYNFRSLVKEQARTLTVLRDPIARTISSIRHLKRDSTFSEAHWRLKDQSLAQIIRNEKVMRQYTNEQAAFLCASIPFHMVTNYLSSVLTINPWAGPLDLEPLPDLEKAEERLRSFDMIGDSNRIDECVDLVSTQMDFHPRSYFPWLNDDPDRENSDYNLSEDDVEILASYNDVDIPLFNYARRLIDERRVRGRLSSLLERGIYKVPSKSFEIGLDGIVPGTGWYEPELEDDRSWRWTGPGRNFSLDLLLPENAAYVVRLTTLPTWLNQGKHLSVEVNGAKMDVQFDMGQDSIVATFSVSQSVIARSNGLCRVVCDTGFACKARDSSDLRLLGLCITKIQFERV